MALLLSLATLQSPLWRPRTAPVCVTAKVGEIAILAYDGEIDKAVIFQMRTASLSSAGSGQLAIYGHEAGKTSLLIRFKDGDSKLYEVVVLPS